MLSGKATFEGMTRYAARFPAQRAAGFYRQVQNRLISNIGIGTYLGDANEVTDRAYMDAVGAAVRGGINIIDTAINYRHQRSERSIGTALYSLFASGDVARDELMICTKAGFLVSGAIPADMLSDDDVVGGIHSMAPAFLADQIQRSRTNLGVDTIDVFYLHNPETQLSFVSPEDFYDRVALAFSLLEQLADEGHIAFYGTATWEGYRKQPGEPGSLSLERLVQIARELRGDRHRFRFLQLPFNLAMPEAFLQHNATFDGKAVSVLEAAACYGLTVVASASLLQGRLSRGLPQNLTQKIGGTSSDAQRAIQFTRSTPGIACALVGMSNLQHVSQNLDLATLSTIRPGVYAGLYSLS